jgi:methylenetetrahydrofolate dehydrogenase (NADP+) / methenyltetrahydrofolate cyclohydrolase
MILLDGTQTALELNEALKVEIDKNTSGQRPKLAIILIGNHPASASYVRGKALASKRVGIEVDTIIFDENSKEIDVLKVIDDLNTDPKVHGMILQLPLPKHLNKDILVDRISILKDADGFHTYHQGLLHQSRKTIIPATPYGIMLLLKHYDIDVKGKQAVVIGRSNIVGAPTARLLMDLGATVTICHSQTKDIAFYTKHADILVVAVGIPNYVTGDMVKEGVVVIDVGINRVGESLVGDVLFSEVSLKASYITPVPKGVGPMTIHGLLKNTYTLFLNQKDKN